MEAQQAKKEFLRQNLTNQINANRQLSEASRQDERRADQKFIRATTNAQNLENAALIRKDQIMK